MTKLSIPVSQLLSSIEIEKDFEIVSDGARYQVSSFFASRLSRKLFQLFIEDPLATEIELQLPAGDFTSVADFLNTGKINVTPENCVFLLHCSHILKSDKLQSTALLSAPTFSLKDAVVLMKEAFENDMDCKKYAEFICKNFKDFLADSSAVSMLNDDAIELIFRSGSVHSEPRNVKTFIDSRVSVSKNTNNRLIAYIPLYVCSPEEITSIISQPGFNINRIRSLLVKRSHSNIKTNSTSVYIALPDRYLEGIIHLFRKPVVRASKCVPGYEPDVLLGNDEKSYYCSAEGPEAFIEFDFGEYHIIAEKYAMKSWSGAKNRVAPRSWSLSGSNDGKTWKVLHEVNDSNILFSDSHIELFPLKESTESFTMFRIQQKLCGNARNRVFALAGFEIFGKVDRGNSGK